MEAEDVIKSMPLRKVALRELPNGSINATELFSADNMVCKDRHRGFNLEFLKVSGLKRCHPGALKFPNDQVSCNTRDEQLEQKCRKTDGQPCQVSLGACSPIDNTLKLHNYADRGSKLKTEGPQESWKPVTSFSTFVPVPICSTVPSQCQSAAYSDGSFITGFPKAVGDYSSVNTGMLVHSQDSKLHWKDRFIQLQALLKSYDQSGQEDYINMLRSLSAAGRSKHAVELEKRAIQLLIDEGRELTRMKVLNVLGKGSPTDQTSVSVPVTTAIPLMESQDCLLNTR